MRRGDLDDAAAILYDEFLITTTGCIAEPVGNQAWLGSLAGRMTLDSFDLRLLATQHFGDVARHASIVPGPWDGLPQRSGDIPAHWRTGAMPP